MQRHRTGLLAFALVLAVLATTTLVAIVNYVRAEQARAAAASRFADAHRAAHYLMFDVVDQLEHRPGTLGLRIHIGHVAETYLDRLSRSPAAPADVKLDLAEGYIRAAMVTGIGNAPNSRRLCPRAA